jgi:hypothetical protein
MKTWPLTPEAALAGRAEALERAFGHPRAGAGRDRVDRHAVLLELTTEHDRQRGDAGLGGGVVGLTGVAEQSRLARRVDDPPVDLLAGLAALAPIDGGEAGRREVTLEVHADDGVPVFLAHVEAHPVAQDARVVDQDVEVAPGLDRLVDEALRALPVGDVVVIGDGLAAGLGDLVDDLLGVTGVGPGPVPLAAEIVHHHLGAFFCE